MVEFTLHSRRGNKSRNELYRHSERGQRSLRRSTARFRRAISDVCHHDTRARGAWAQRRAIAPHKIRTRVALDGRTIAHVTIMFPEMACSTTSSPSCGCPYQECVGGIARFVEPDAIDAIDARDLDDDLPF